MEIRALVRELSRAHFLELRGDDETFKIKMDGPAKSVVSLEQCKMVYLGSNITRDSGGGVTSYSSHGIVLFAHHDHAYTRVGSFSLSQNADMYHVQDIFTGRSITYKGLWAIAWKAAPIEITTIV